MTELITKEDLEKYSSAIYMDCSICGEDTKMIFHDGSPICDECLLSIMSHEGESLIPDMEERLEYIDHKISNIPYSMIDIKKIIEAHFQLPKGSLEQRTRKRSIVQPRQIAMVISKLKTKYSLAIIGSEIGEKDHATVLHAIKTVVNLYETSREFRNQFDPILYEFKCEKEFKYLCLEQRKT